ncbi:MAG: CDP-glycerol glycerophosphotransferase family protein [bacterium]|nr:CDP-glycerol glycerophosphotransferase family protein [bacterium]MDZ4342244.1 CDP-glycerol glycerophosphotransferase family protein [Candidatus Binatia bacterium]
MKIAVSAPTGFNTRELLLPLAPLLKNDPVISHVQVLTPAADYLRSRLNSLGDKFSYHQTPSDQTGHDKLLNQLQPDIVVTPTIGLDSSDLPIIRAAHRHNIPSCAFIASWDNVYKIERLIKYGREYALPDHLAVWNSMMRDHALRLFSQYREKIDIIGVPRFDFFYHNHLIPDRQQFLTSLSLKPDQKLIHCATTELYPFGYIIQSIKQAVSRRQLPGNTSIYASVHPGGDISRHLFYRQYGAKVEYSFGRRSDSPSPHFHYLPTYEEIYRHVALFKHSAILINQSSTVAIESMLADVPVVNVKYGRRFDWWRWYRSMVYRDFRQHYRDIISSGGTTVVNNEKQLILAMQKYLTDPAFKQNTRLATIKKLITYTDGQSSQRLINLLKRVSS